MSDDTPTTPIRDGASVPTEPRAGSGSRGLLIALLAVGGAILVALVVLLVVLLAGRGPGAPVATDSPTPEPTVSASATPDATPSDTPSAEPTATTAPPPPPSPIEAYSASTTRVDCAGGGSVPVTFRWTTSADSVTFGVGTDRADEAPYQSGLPSTGEITIDYQCGQASGQQRYAIAAISGGSVVDRETVVIRE